MNALLELQRISKSFVLPSGESLDILRDLDLTIQAGEMTAIVGRSGSGKSTLLNTLGMLDRPTSGTYLCAGKDVAILSDSQVSFMRGSFLGFIFQQFYLMDRRTALENVAEPFLYGKAGGIGERRARATALLEKVGLADRATSMPHLLSGGEQQRVAIARALARRPSVVLADEPTGSLDATTGELVLDLLLDLVRREGVTLILVTHDLAIAGRADRVLTLRDGKLYGEHEP